MREDRGGPTLLLDSDILLLIVSPRGTWVLLCHLWHRGASPNLQHLEPWVLQCSGFRKTEHHSASIGEYINQRGSLWTSVGSELLPHYTGCHPLAAAFARHTLPWDRPGQDSDSRALHPLQHTDWIFPTFSSSREKTLYQARPKGHLEHNSHQVFGFCVFREGIHHLVVRLLWDCHRGWMEKCIKGSLWPEPPGTKCQGSIWFCGDFILHFEINSKDWIHGL